MFEPDMRAEDVDAGGASNTDNEEEPLYGCITYHLTHRNDMEPPTQEEEDDEKKDEPSDQKKDTVADAPAESDEEDDDKETIRAKILFSLQRDFEFEWLNGNKKVVLVRLRADVTRAKMALKIVRDTQCVRSNQLYFPMEIRVLSYIRSQPPAARQHLQFLQGFHKRNGGYAFLSPYAPDIRQLSDNMHRFHESPHEIRMIMFQLLTALQNLHAMHVIHRDVKQSNILWENNVLTLIDFDQATWDRPGRKHYAVLGTYGYIAPEVFAFERDGTHDPAFYDTKIDIYSAGVVFGSLLFDVSENDVSEVYVRAFRQRATALLQTDLVAANLLLSMLEMDPVKRPTASALLRHEYFHQH